MKKMIIGVMDVFFTILALFIMIMCIGLGASWPAVNAFIGMIIGGILVEGMVEDSRVKYGTDIQYRVKLQHPYNFFGALREVVLVDGSNITEVL